MKICKANNQLCLKLEVKLLYKDFKTSEEKWSYDLGAGSWELGVLQGDVRKRLFI